MRHRAPILLILANLLIHPIRADPPPAEAVSFGGRVVEKVTGKPVAGAKLVISRRLLVSDGKDRPAWVGKSTLETDAEGRFTLDIPADQVAEPRLEVKIERIEHPEFVTRTGQPFSVISLLHAQKFGDKLPFETIEIGRGTEYHGQILEPDGKPAAGVPFEFTSWSQGNISQHFTNLLIGKTDADGRYRLRLPRQEMLQIRTKPERFLAVWKMWGNHQNDVVDPDLGTITLKAGPCITGRLLDLDGKPIPGQRLVAHGLFNQLNNRTATTDENGWFAFGPLPPANYVVAAIEQSPYSPDGVNLPPLSRGKKVIRPAKLFFKKGEVPAPIELREVPSVAVEIRFVDSTGRPGQAWTVSLGGWLPWVRPPEKAPAAPDALESNFEPLRGLSAFLSNGFQPAMNANQQEQPVEVEQLNTNLPWFCHSWPETNGKTVIRAPKGLMQTYMNVVSPPETVSYKIRISEKEDWIPYTGVGVGNLEADGRKITVMSFRAPTVVLQVKTEDGEAVRDYGVSAQAHNGKNLFGVNLYRQNDGRFRTEHLLPGMDYEFWANHAGFLPNTKERIHPVEGETVELTLLVRRQPKLPEVGDLAPGFVVRMLDGSLLSLDDLRDKLVLLSFWNPYDQQNLEAQKEFKAIHTRFGNDPRFAMLSLNMSNDVDHLTKLVKELGHTWPQAMLRDGALDPIITSYLPYGGVVYGTFLIGPDGVLLAKNITAANAAEEIAKALK